MALCENKKSFLCVYKRKINLKSLRWNVPGIDTAHVSVVMCGVGQTHILTE